MLFPFYTNFSAHAGKEEDMSWRMVAHFVYVAEGWAMILSLIGSSCLCH